jgi:cytochrome c-type biogenesis protein CcmE
MTQMAWEKPLALEKPKGRPRSGSWKFALGGALMLVAVVYLVFSGTMVGARFFITVEEVVNNPAYLGQKVRITGAVIGPTIDYDPVTGRLEFTIAHLPSEYEDLATELHRVANNPVSTRLHIVMSNQTKPDLLQHEAQAILTGTMREDGTFYATEVLLKCPSRFQENTPGNMIHLMSEQ